MSRRPERGQTLVIFAIAAVFLVGVSALAVDFGLITSKHRSVQEYADTAAMAGASQLNQVSPQPADYTRARTNAFIYLRSSLNLSPTTAGLTATLVGCGHVDFSSDLDNCALPAPNSNYVISIDSPAHGVVPNISSQLNTVSVAVTETIGTVLARTFSQSNASSAVSAVAQISPSSFSPFSLWSAGVVSVGNQFEVLQGDVYIDSGGLVLQSNGKSAFCAEQGPAGAGNIVFGKGTLAGSIPSIATNQSRAACLGTGGGTVSAMGTTSVSNTNLRPPTFSPPANIPVCSVCADAVASNTCVNHTVNSTPIVPSNCFSPGAYRSISGIANNLNPGTYHIVGEQDPASANYLKGQVTFSGNTLNANFVDVRDSCWAPPNGSGSFTAPCPDGLAFSPTAVTDPQCGGSGSALAVPSFTLTPSALGGTLDPVGTGTTYYVRVSAQNAYGETATTESSVKVISPTNTGSIQLSITAVPGATGYQVYGPATAANTELSYVPALVAPVATQLLTAKAAGSTPYPRFDTSSCSTGFHNIPKNQYENDGVTFVLDNQVDFTVSSGLTVMLSPYCSVLANNDVAPGTSTSCSAATQPGDPPGPYANSGPNVNDGAFPLYGTTTGTFGVSMNGTQLGLVGTVDLPSAPIAISQNAAWEVIPGQVIGLSVTVQSGNHQNPAILASRTFGARVPSVVRLVE